MPFIPAPNIVMIEWRMTLSGQKIENRLHLDVAGTPTQAALDAYAQFAWNWWENTYAPLIVNACLLREVVATDLSSINGLQSIYAPDATTTGGVNLQALPNEVAFCLSLHTAFRGRSARGRWYVGGIPNNALNDANNLTTAAAEAFRAALQVYIDVFDTGSIKPVIVSYRSNKALRPGGPVYFVIQSVVVTDTIVDSQRRRKPGVGE
jgi:hypothetical protein